MKKLNLLRLLFGAMFLIAATAFTSCVDDNDDDGMPYLEVAPEALTFSAEGVAEGASAVTVKSNRPWTLAFESGADWVTPSATDGKAGTTEVEFSIPASNESRTATLSFQLKNSYGAYFTKTVTIQQGEAPVAGAVSELVAFIKDTHAGVESGNTVPLGYSKASIEAVILANNEYGNNFGKLYVGDNISLPNSAIVLYDTKEFTKANSVNYPVGKKVTLELSGAEYSPFGNLRELKGVTVTVSDDDPVELVIPSLSAATFNSGNYQGQYVRVNDLTPQSAYVGEAWATGAKRKVVLDGPSSTTVQSYMATATDAPDFGMLYIKAATGPMLGTAEQNFNNIQLIPTKPSDVAAFVSNDPILSVDPETVSLNAAAGSSGTFAVTSNGDWTVAKASGDGFTFDPDKGSQNGTVTITASKANETNAEVTLGTLTVTDGTNTKTVTVKQKIASSDILFENFGTNPVSENTDVAQFNDYLRDGSGVTAQTTYTGNKASIRKTGAPDTDAISGPNALWVASNGYFDVNKLKLESGETKLQIKFAAMASNAAVGASDITLSLSGNDGGSWKTVTYELESIAGESKYKWVICNFTLKTAVSELSLRIASSVGTRVDDLSVTTGAGGQEVDLPTSGVVTEPITIPEIVNAMTGTATVIDNDKNRTFEAVVCGDKTFHNYPNGYNYLMTPGSSDPKNGIVLYNFDLDGKFETGDKIKVTLKAGTAKSQLYSNSVYQISGVTEADIEVLSQNNAITPVKVAPTAIQNYFGMPVTVENTTTSTGGVWQPVPETLSNVTVSSAGTDFVVNFNKMATGFDFAYVATTGTISGIATIFDGKGQIAPRNAADLAAFNGGAATPAVTTANASNVAETTVTLGGSIANADLADYSAVGVEYVVFATGNTPDWTGSVKVPAATKAATWTVDVTGLTKETQYAFRAYATPNTGDILYGDHKTFVTTGGSGGATTITIPELLAKITATSAAEVIDENVTYTFEGVICGDPKAGNASFGTLYVMTPGATTGGNGISLYNSVFWSEGDYKLGDKVLVTLTAGVAKGQIRNSIPQVSEIGTGEVIVQSSGNAVTPIKVNSVADISNYFNMPVTIEATTSAAGMWMDSGANTTRTLTAGGANLAVYFNKNAWTTFQDQPYSATTAEITGIAAVYSGNNQILPRNLDDVKNFKSSTPMIVAVTPTLVNFPAAGGSETLVVEVVNMGSNTLSTSGLSGILSAEVNGSNVVVTAEANPNASEVSQTLTISLSGGNSVNVPITVLGTAGGPTYTLISQIADLSAGKYYMAGYVEDAAPYNYQMWTGTVSYAGTGTTSNSDLVTVPYQYTSNQLNPERTAVTTEIELVAVNGKDNTYYIKVGDKYLYNSVKTTNRRLYLKEATENAEWVFMDKSNGTGMAPSNNGVYLITASASSNYIRSYKTETQTKVGVFFFKKN